MEQLLLGIDIGTSACKVALFTKKGEVIGIISEAYDVFYPQPGFVEQDANQWWDAVCSAVKTLLTRHKIDAKRIAGVGVDGQSWSAIPIDNTGNVLHNTPIWMDSRAASICEELLEKIDENDIFDVCGNPMQPTYTLPKILWFKKRRPDIYEKTHAILQSNSFIVYRLTDKLSQDVSQGYGLQCFDMKNGCWHKEMCEKLGVDMRILPPLYQCHEVVGYVTNEAAERTGLLEGTPVVAGGLDAACGTLGAGVLKNGQAQEQGGQAGGMSICIDTYHADKRLILSNHVVPNKWLLQGGSVGGGGVIRWFEKEFCHAERQSALENNSNSYEEMNIEAEKISIGSDGLVFLPYMAGERSPIWDTHAKGVYYGLDYSKTRAHMIRASFEGVAFSLLHNLEVAEEAKVSVSEFYSVGGAANSKLWTQMKAEVTGKKISVPASDTATTLGAALLAGVGVGMYESFEEAVAMTVKVNQEYAPDLENYEKYRRFYKIYRALYENLKDLMKNN